MCIGKYSADEGSALSDFEALVQCRARAAEAVLVRLPVTPVAAMSCRT